jgi:hypothetical protein
MNLGKIGLISDTKMTNFIEELNAGDCFENLDGKYIVTSDFKKDGSKLSIDLKSGTSRWFKPDIMVTKIGIFHTDKDGNIIALKELKKDDINA